MPEQFNPLDPLGIFEPVRQDLDRLGQDLQLPKLPGPPGLPRRTEAERAQRHGGSPPPRGTGFQRLLDPAGIMTRGKATIGNPIPAEFNGDLVAKKEIAERVLLDKGYDPRLVEKALKWFEEWVMGMARRLAPGDIDLQRRVVHSAYTEVAARAEEWINGIQQAFGVPA